MNNSTLVTLNNQRVPPSRQSSLRSISSRSASPQNGFYNNNNISGNNNINNNSNVAQNNGVQPPPSSSSLSRRGSVTSRYSNGAGSSGASAVGGGQQQVGGATPIDSRQNSVCFSRRTSLLGRLSNADSFRVQTSFGSASLDEYQHNDLVGASTCSAAAAAAAGYPTYAGDQATACGAGGPDVAGVGSLTKMEKNWARAKKNGSDRSVESMTAATSSDGLLV